MRLGKYKKPGNKAEEAGLDRRMRQKTCTDKVVPTEISWISPAVHGRSVEAGGRVSGTLAVFSEVLGDAVCLPCRACGQYLCPVGDLRGLDQGLRTFGSKLETAKLRWKEEPPHLVSLL